MESEVKVTAVISAGICICIFIMSSCTIKHADRNNITAEIDNARIDTYLDRGCKKVSVIGSSGTHWVCNGERNE